MEKLDGAKLNKPVRTAVQTAALLVIFTIISKLLGFAREIFMAGYFGTSFVTDAYVMAQNVPGIIIGGFFVAIETAFMPLFSKIVENEGEEEGNKFTNQVICLSFTFALAICLLGIIFSDQIVNIIAYKFDEKTAELTSFYLKITFTYMLFTSISGILEVFLRYKGVFIAPVVIGYLQNFCVIGIIIASTIIGFRYLAVGLLIGYFAKLCADIFIVKRKGFHFQVSMQFSNTAKRIITLSLPVFIGGSINQINTFVDKSLASGLIEGSIAALNYGNLITSTIIGLTITIITTIIYPKMTRAQSRGDTDYFNEMVSTGFNLICIIAVPFSLGAMLYSNQIVQIIFERGAFDASSTGLTDTALFYYAAGMLFVSINQLFVQAFYSMHDMKTPVICGAVGAVVNIILNLILVRYLAHGGLALATSIAAMINAIMLYYMMCEKYPQITMVRSRRKAIKICIAAVVAVGISALTYYFVILLIADIIYMRTVQLAIAVGVAVAVYYLMLKKMKIDELDLIKQLFVRRNDR